MIRLKKCRNCNQELPLSSFTSTMAKYCKNCRYIVLLEKKHQATVRRLERTKNIKQKKKTVIKISDLKQKAQKVFNKWIRERDKDDGCISCDSKTASGYDAGHFWPMGSKGALRYNEDNTHKQCRNCNKWKSGNLLEYRVRLIKKIGVERVNWLEEHRNDIKKWNREELEEIVRKYTLP